MLSDFKNYEGFDIVFIFFGLLTHFAVAGDILIPGDTSSQLSLFYMYLKIQQSIMNVVKENSRCWGKVQVEESFYNPMMCTAQASLSLVPYSDSVSLWSLIPWLRISRSIAGGFYLPCPFWVLNTKNLKARKSEPSEGASTPGHISGPGRFKVWERSGEDMHRAPSSSKPGSLLHWNPALWVWMVWIRRKPPCLVLRYPTASLLLPRFKRGPRAHSRLGKYPGYARRQEKLLQVCWEM